MQDWGEDIFKPTTWNDTLHQDSNDNGVRTVKFATSNNPVVKSTMFPYRNIHKYTWTSPEGKKGRGTAFVAEGSRDGYIPLIFC